MGVEATRAGEGLTSRGLAGVERIRPILAAQCEAEERRAHLSRASADALYDAGVLQMKAPRVSVAEKRISSPSTKSSRRSRGSIRRPVGAA